MSQLTLDATLAIADWIPPSLSDWWRAGRFYVGFRRLVPCFDPDHAPPPGELWFSCVVAHGDTPGQAIAMLRRGRWWGR